MGGLFLQAPTKPRADEIAEPTMELADILHICNTAHRHKYGDLVWLSWIGNSQRTCHPSHAATLMAVSYRGAYRLALQMGERSSKLFFGIAISSSLRLEYV